MFTAGARDRGGRGAVSLITQNKKGQNGRPGQRNFGNKKKKNPPSAAKTANKRARFLKERGEHQKRGQSAQTPLETTKKAKRSKQTALAQTRNPGWENGKEQLHDKDKITWREAECGPSPPAKKTQRGSGVVGGAGPQGREGS